MGKKKRPFIDKKKAENYTLVRRSQRDVGGYFDEETGEPLDIPREFVLLPSSNKKQPTKKNLNVPHVTDNNDVKPAANTGDDVLSRAREQLTQAGLLDEYDYDSHLKPITGYGVFIQRDRNGGESVTNNPRSSHVPLEDNVMELDRQLDTIDVSANCMDDDVAQALFGNFEDGGFEEILDDFCLTAGQETAIENVEDNDKDADFDGQGLGIVGNKKKVVSASNPDFDFDKHVQMLIKKAKREENGGVKVEPQSHEWWQKNQKEFQSVKPHHQLSSSDDDDDNDKNDIDSLDREFDGDEGELFTEGVVSKLKPEEEMVLCEKFEQTLLEYDSDEIGDLDDKYQDIVGDKPIEGDIHIDAAFDQFIQAKKDDIFIQGSASIAGGNKRSGGGSHVLVGRRMVPPNSAEVEKANQEVSDKERLENVLAKADQILASPEMDLPPEEVLIDGKSYFTMKERNPWDCESILSTYSNLDNNPAVIERSSNRRRRKKKDGGDGKKSTVGQDSLPEEEPVQIELSNKTGLPLGVFPTELRDDFHDEQTFASVNKGVARKKDETKEQKKNRKKLVKQEKEVSRIQKKMMKEAFQNEFRKHAGNTAADDVAGMSVFRF